ncbi:hypothetical protein MRX96_011625 [Rhipicephalus microplus]
MSSNVPSRAMCPGATSSWSPRDATTEISTSFNPIGRVVCCPSQPCGHTARNIIAGRWHLLVTRDSAGGLKRCQTRAKLTGAVPQSDAGLDPRRHQ